MEFALIVSSDFTPKARAALVNGKILESCTFFWVTHILGLQFFRVKNLESYSFSGSHKFQRHTFFVFKNSRAGLFLGYKKL